MWGAYWRSTTQERTHPWASFLCDTSRHACKLSTSRHIEFPQRGLYQKRVELQIVRSGDLTCETTKQQPDTLKLAHLMACSTRRRRLARRSPNPGRPSVSCSSTSCCPLDLVLTMELLPRPPTVKHGAPPVAAGARCAPRSSRSSRATSSSRRRPA